MKKSFDAVWKGSEKGIYHNWNESINNQPVAWIVLNLALKNATDNMLSALKVPIFFTQTSSQASASHEIYTRTIMWRWWRHVNKFWKLLLKTTSCEFFKYTPLLQIYKLTTWWLSVFCVKFSNRTKIASENVHKFIKITPQFKQEFKLSINGANHNVIYRIKRLPINEFIHF